MEKKVSAMPATSKDITITLNKDLQDEFESYLEVCKSLEFPPRINGFLNYIYNYGTCKNPKEPQEWD